MEDTSQFYIDFTVDDSERFLALSRAFAALQQDKNRQIQAQNDEEAARAFREEDQWLAFFDERARAHFWWPSQAELDAHTAQWFATPLPDRWTDPTLKRPWLFSSMIYAFQNAEFELLTCHMLTSNTARITFDPWAHPYGGTGCLKALVEAFDCKVIAESD